MTARHTLKIAFAGALAAAAVAPAGAAAHFDSNPVYFPGTGAGAAPAVRYVRVQDGGGFDWGDAAIGAAAGLGVSILGLAGSRVRGRRTAGSTAAIG